MRQATLGALPREGLRARATRHRADAAVSPVIGMVLILAISVLGIVAVTNWGLPAILAMQQNVEVRTVMNDFTVLDGSLQKLIAGTTGQTTFKWQPTVGQGAVDVDPTGHRWLLATDVDGTKVVHWKDMGDKDDVVVVHTTNFPAAVRFQAWRWVDGVATEVILHPGTGTCSTSAHETDGWGNGADRTYYLRTNASSGCTPVNIDNGVFSFSLRTKQGGAVTVYHEAYLADTGHVHWDSVGGTPARRHVYHTNGAVYEGGPGYFSLGTPLALSPPRSFTSAAGDSEAMFGRLLKVNGTASFAGSGGGQRLAVFMDYVGTYTLGAFDDVQRVYAYVWGPTNSSTYAELKSATAGYGFTQHQTAGSEPNEMFVRYEQTSKPFRFRVAYTLVEVER
jgi:hypothetical protein